jgi:membrane protease YdiL (CAAX protease family)
MPDVTATGKPGRPLLEVLGVAAGMVVFALFSHRGLPWILVGLAGLLITAATLERSVRCAPGVAASLGLDGVSMKTMLLAVLGCAIGVGGGMLHRRSLGLPLLPAGLERFALVACLIGAMEELIYRGWLQGRLRPLGWPVAVAAAAAAHTAYKAALFVWPPWPSQIDCAAIVEWTFIGGVIAGLLRQFSRSVVPPMAAHAVFDLAVYGAVVHAPWWVWG